MSKKPVDSGRVETILAALVLIAVIGLFIRFQLVEGQNTTPEPTQIETKAVNETVPADAIPQQ